MSTTKSVWPQTEGLALALDQKTESQSMVILLLLSPTFYHRHRTVEAAQILLPCSGKDSRIKVTISNYAKHKRIYRREKRKSLML
jgi:hypothetical protein